MALQMDDLEEPMECYVVYYCSMNDELVMLNAEGGADAIHANTT